MKSARRKKYFIIACAALLLVLLAQPAQAATKNWVGPKPNTLWSNPNNWGPITGQPGPNDTVNLTSTSTKSAFYDVTSSSPSQLIIDATGGGTFTLTQAANTLNVSGAEIIGNNGKGAVVQSGGTHADDSLTLGNNSGSSGTYTLSGGGSLSSNIQEIGKIGSTGLFNQTGGSNTVGIALTLGSSGGSGTYNLTGGHLQAPNETIGEQGTGTFTQSTNSTNIISDTLALGSVSGMVIPGSGTYYMKGGYLQTNDEVVGDQGKGTFTQSGGTHQAISQLILGNFPIGNGTFTLLAGGLSAGNEDIGGFGTGQFIQSGGTNTVANDFVLATDTAASSGAYTLNAGQLQAHRELIGNDGTGVFTQNGGTNTVGTSNTAGNDLTLGANSGANVAGNGTYNLVKGSLSVAHDETVGNDGTGTFNQIGGTHTVTNTLNVGIGLGSGTYNLQGGTLSAGTPFDGVLDIRIKPGGTFNVKNTTTTVTGDVINQGLVKTTNANVTWNGNFQNNGAYISDPSTQTFNQNLNVDGSGYLVGGSQDLFVIKNDFQNSSNNSTQWNTVLSTLKFVTGADNIHNFDINGQGATPVNNFAWGTLNITGQIIHLRDGNPPAGGDQWLDGLIGAKYTAKAQNALLTNIFNTDNDPLNLWYEKNLAANAYLGGFDYLIPADPTVIGSVPGHLFAHTPLPPSVFLLGSGLLGLGALGWRRRKVKS